MSFSVEIYEHEIEEDAWIDRYNSHASNWAGGYEPRTSQETFCAKASAWRKAKELALHFGRPDAMNGPLWPVVWGDKGETFLYTPRPTVVNFLSKLEVKNQEHQNAVKE